MIRETNRVWINIHLDALNKNLELLRSKISEGTKVMAIVKADAYGHGALVVAQEIANDVDWFGVATPEEALILRKKGIRNPILVLGVVRPAYYSELIENGVRFSLFSWQDAVLCSKAAEYLGREAMIHIKVDTGMHRIGFLPDEASLELIRRLMNLRGIYLEGIFTHFARADETDKSSADEQLKVFLDFRKRLEDMGITWLIAHASNSAAALEMPEANLDMVRFGVSLYGMAPSDECGADLPLSPVLELKSRISFLKTLPAGCPISYGGTYVTDKTTRVATVPIGYGDGYPRALSNSGKVLVRSMEAPILGRVCMDQLMIDVTDIPDVREDDVVTLVGRDRAKEIRVEDLEKWGDVFRYEFTCCLNKRVPRIYLRSGSVIAMRNHFNE